MFRIYSHTVLTVLTQILGCVVIAIVGADAYSYLFTTGFGLHPGLAAVVIVLMLGLMGLSIYAWCQHTGGDEEDELEEAPQLSLDQQEYLTHMVASIKATARHL